MIDKDKIDTVKLCRCTCGCKARIWFEHVGTDMYECNIGCSNKDCKADNLARGGNVEKTAPRWNNKVKTDVTDTFIKTEKGWITAEQDKYRGGDNIGLFDN